MDYGKDLERCMSKAISFHEELDNWWKLTDHTDVWSLDDCTAADNALDMVQEAFNDLTNSFAEYQWKSRDAKDMFSRQLSKMKRRETVEIDAYQTRRRAKVMYDLHVFDIICALADADGPFNRDLLALFVKQCERKNVETLGTWAEMYDGGYLPVEGDVDEDEVEYAFKKYKSFRRNAYQAFAELTKFDPHMEPDPHSTAEIDRFCLGEYSAKEIRGLVAEPPAQALTENRFYGLFKGDVVRDPSSIVGVEMISSKANQCKIQSDGRSVYTAAKMYPGDIIEICPTRGIDKTSLYTKDMRDIVFEVVPNEQYVIPFGYCQYYDLADERHPANCDFTWDPENQTIVIKATQKLPNGARLYLNILK